MKKSEKVKKIAAKALIAGLAVGIPTAGVMPSAVLAAEASEFKLEISQGDGGMVLSQAKGSVKYDEVFTLTAVADEGYRFSHWELDSRGYHSVVSGSEYDAEISVNVSESLGDLFTAKAVFVKDDVHVIRNGEIIGITYAKAGDVIALDSNLKDGAEDRSDDRAYIYRSYGFDISRASDGASIKKDVYDSSTHTFTMPDYDIEISQYVSSSSVAKVLADDVMTEESLFYIENNTDGVADIPETAEFGDVIEIITLSGQEDVAPPAVSYRIERVADGEDMTDLLMLDDTRTSFTMPQYDIKVYPVFPETSSIEENPESEAVPTGSGIESEKEPLEKILADVIYDDEYDGAVTDQEQENSENTADTVEEKEENEEESSVENKDDNEDSKNPPLLSAGASRTDSVPAGGRIAATSTPVSSAPVSSTAVGTAPIARSVSSPVAIRAQGSSVAAASPVSNPRTGDYNATASFTIAAIASAVGIAAAAVILKRRKVD